MNVVQDVVKSLPAVLWVLSGVLIYASALATYVVLVEQRRRKRTNTDQDDWR